ncbi:MAG: ABC transporter substrate-binding protein [Methanomassiliicoccales archaeon]
MEGSGDKPLPEEKAAKGGSKRKIAVVAVVIILIVAAVLAALVLIGEKYVEPTASFTVTSQVNQGDSVTFNASASAGKLTNYTWTMGDGQVRYGGPILTYMYSAAGIMLVTLKVFDAKKNVTSDPKRISVIAQEVVPSNTSAPVAVIVSSAEVTQNVVENGTAVTLKGAASYTYTWNGSAFVIDPAAINSHTWKIDGVAAAVSQNFTAAMLSVGTHYVSLTVTDTKGGSGSYIVSIVVLAQAPGPASGKTYVMVTIDEPYTLDPAIDYESAGGEILNNVYETLVWYNGSSASELVPMLATIVPTVANGGISSDGLNYTFNLRQNVKFHDGNIMTSADVKYSIQRLLMINDPGSPAWILGVLLISNYTAENFTSASQAQIDAAISTPDANTVVFHLIDPYPAFLYCIAYTEASIVSKAYVEAHGGIVKETKNDWMERHECGTGPYSLVNWESNQYVLMQRFDNYWRTPAAIQYVLIKKVLDVGTREMLLFNGDADSAYIPRNHASDVVGVNTLRIVKDSPTFGLDFLGLNQNINVSGSLNPGVPSTFFADKNVRLAFISAFNYSNYLEVSLGGSAVEPNGIIPAGMFGYNASIPKYNFDLQAAANYLKNATNPAGGGSYADTGFSITLYYNAGYASREDSCFLLKNGLESLKAKGLIAGTIRVTVIALDWPTYLDAMQGNNMPAFFLGWLPDYADPDDYVNLFIDKAGTYAQTVGIVNDDLTNLSRAAAKELNTTLRAEMYSEISMQVYENAYYLWTDQQTSFHVERTWVSGYYFNPMYSGYYYYSFDKTV